MSDSIVTGLAVDALKVAVMTPISLTLYNNQHVEFRMCDTGLTDLAYTNDECVVLSQNRGKTYCSAYPSGLRFVVSGTKLCADYRSLHVCGNGTISTFIA